MGSKGDMVSSIDWLGASMNMVLEVEDSSESAMNKRTMCHGDHRRMMEQCEFQLLEAMPSMT